ncbi:MAG TPA: hypothetical protein VMX13_00220 [Sedimentisphaerales bacterium]|nr:hypothetical protein [Sedimentisphaerales bacterium]
MSTNRHQLRYYIALSAPPTRTLADGAEAFMRPEPGFNPSWFHKYCGIDFSERWHKDIDYRLQCHQAMSDEVRRRFPGRNIGQVNEDKAPDLLTGLYGTAVVPVMFGQSIRYFPDKWPAPHGEHLTDEQADALSPAAPDKNELFQDILSQIDKIQQLTGAARGYLNWQGVPNTAFRLRGEQIFMDLFDTPDRAHHIFECVTLTMINGIKRLHEKQKQTGVDEKFATISNCVVNMISPEHYREHLLPYDLRIRAEFEKFGIHNCAWVVDPYMEAYAIVPKLGYIDMGITSDLKKARQLFPDTRRTVLYTSMDLANKSEAQIRDDFEKIAEELAPCDVGLPDIEVDVPDERVMFAMDLCAEFSEKYGVKK